jgi:inward rectifier potassium channel
MALLRGINQKQKSENTGFGTNANSYGGRFINKNGTANIESDMHLLHRISWYHTMIDMPAWRFMLIILSFMWELILFLPAFIME